MRHAGQPVTRDMIGGGGLGQGLQRISTIVEVFVNRLRQKLEQIEQPPLIVTVRGAGYCLASNCRRPAAIRRLPMTIRLRLTIYWAAITAMILVAAGLRILLFERQHWGALDGALMEEADTSAAGSPASAGRGDTDPIQRLSEESDLGLGRRVRIVIGDPVFDVGDIGADLPDAVAERVGDGRRRTASFPLCGIPPLKRSARIVGRRRRCERDPQIDRVAAHEPAADPAAYPVASVAGGYVIAGRALLPIITLTGALAPDRAARFAPRLPRRRGTRRSRRN